MPLRLKPQRVTARALNQVPVPGGGHQQGELDERLLPLRHGHWALRGAGAHAHRAAPHRRRGRRRASRAVMSDGPRAEGGCALCACGPVPHLVFPGLCFTWPLGVEVGPRAVCRLQLDPPHTRAHFSLG